MKKALYTISFGKYDSLKEPKVITPGWDYIVFTNNKDLVSGKWIVQYIELDLPNNLAARYCYMNAATLLPSYDMTIMIGGQLSCDGNLDDFLKKYIDLNYDYNLMKHCRDCIYKEAKENKTFFGVKGQGMIDTQMNNYRMRGFPPEYGLYAHGIIISLNNEKTKAFQEAWWKEVSNDKYVTRDQLSFMYTEWATKLITHRSFGDYWDMVHTEFFSIWSHGTGEIKKL